MAADNETFQQPALSVGPERPVPGVLVVWSQNIPRCIQHPVEGTRTLGRDAAADIRIDGDTGVSRKHCEISFSNGRFTVRDLGSTYGTIVNGQKINGTQTFDRPPILRVGGTLLECRLDVSPFDLATCVMDGRVSSPHLRTAFARAGWAARENFPLLVRGESGTGKEAVAQAFHRRGPRAKGPFIVESCATLKESVAEAELFGVRKGGFTGASDRDGLIERADGGSLYLDEFAELAPNVQAMLLRVLETKELRPVGGRATLVVDFALVVATDIDLEAAVAAGKFRNQLFARVNQASVTLLPLRERRDEIPFLIAAHRLVASGKFSVTTDFVEQCLLRSWPTNIRGLHGQIARACQNAETERNPRFVLAAHDVDEPGEILPLEEDEPTRLRRMLREENGNASAVARRLDMKKTTLAYRLEKYGIKG